MLRKMLNLAAGCMDTCLYMFSDVYVFLISLCIDIPMTLIYPPICPGWTLVGLGQNNARDHISLAAHLGAPWCQLVTLPTSLSNFLEL